MAAVRCAARRLGCSLLQRAQATATSPAVAEGRRRQLVPRGRIHTDEHVAAAPRLFEEYPESEIQHKKEELYTLISEARKQFPGESPAGNIRLLQSLSLHVEPRPHDPQWRRLNRSMQVSKWLYGGGIASWVLATWLLGLGEVAAAQRKNASSWGEQASHCQCD